MSSRTGRSIGSWSMFALIAVLLAIGSVGFLRRISFRIPHTGAEWVQTQRGPLALEVEPDSAAAIAGLVPGDRLVAIDGNPVTRVLDATDRTWNANEAIRWTLERGGRTIVLDVIPGVKPSYRPYGFLSVVGIAFLLSAAFIEWRGAMVRGGRLYVWLATTFFVHIVFSHTGLADPFDWLIYTLDVIAGASIPAILMQFAAVQSRWAPFGSRPSRVWFYLPTVMLLGMAWWLSPAGGGGDYLFDNPLLAENLRERIEPLWLGLAVVFAVVVLTRAAARTASATYRSQARWLLAGVVAGLVPYISLSAIPFAFGAEPQAPWVAFLAVLPMLLMPAIFATALARYRLFDLNTWVRRSVVMVTAVFFTVGLYALAREIASELLSASISAARYFGLFAAFLSFAPIRALVRRGVEKMFYRERYSYRATLLDWARELNAETDLRTLLQRLERRVRETLGVEDARIWLYREEDRFEWFDASGETTEIFWPDVVRALPEQTGPRFLEQGLPGQSGALWAFPLQVKSELSAMLTVLERTAPDTPLSTEDRGLLNTLAEHAASAIKSARLLRAVRRHSEQIESLHARQERILESSAVGLALANIDGEVLGWNRALEEIHGLPREEAIGRPLREVLPEPLMRRLRRERVHTEPGEETRLYRYSMVNRKGHRVVVNITVAPAGGKAAQDDAWVLTFDDISERVKMEQQLLRQERLASLGMLAAGVAHEVNTPLTGISSYTQLLLEEIDPQDPRRETLEKIDFQTQRATDIVQSLLRLSRVEHASFAALSLNEMIREVLQLFEPQVRRRAIKVKTSLDNAVPEIEGHRGKLQQVLLNLLINARDAVGEEGTITISTRERDGCAVVEVMDDGGGIAEEDLPRIFDPFFTTKTRGKGTGLGLSISYGLIQEHDGEIQVESEPGTFTKFRIELPVQSRVG